MSCRPDDVLKYKRSRFTTKLMRQRRYTPSHYWMQELEPGLWQVGFTRFAMRMLGELVELEFETAPGVEMKRGQFVGWVEAFKAVSDIYCVMDGRFEGPNPLLEKDMTLLDTDTHGSGWLYLIRGAPGEDSLDAEGYAGLLDRQIDKMTGEEHGH